jgi:GAF domain-containing protein
VSAGPNPSIDPRAIEQERQRLGRRLDEVARLCESSVQPQVFFEEMLKRLLESLAAPAGAVWVRTAQGNLVLQFQVNLGQVGLDRGEEARQAHEALLRHFVAQPRPLDLPPRSGTAPGADGKVGPGNPTDHLLLLVPVMINGQLAGILEVFQGANRPASAIPGFKQFMGLMADLCARYQRNQMMGQLAGQQQLWTQLEVFARQVHGSLHPTEVAYVVANEGARLIEADRVSVAVRESRSARIEAVSGADTVEKRSKEVRLMRLLCDRVLDWGERLVFRGVPDDSLPPKVLTALDNYLHERPSKLLVVEPLFDERQKPDKDKGTEKKPARSALFMECFEPPPDQQQLLARLEVVARHATPALYNAVEYRRIPMRWIWLPLAKLQEGLGGKTKAIATLVVVALSVLIAAMIFVPYELKMDAEGKLLPEVRAQTFPPNQGVIQEFHVEPGDIVRPGAVLADMEDSELAYKLHQLERERQQAIADALVFTSQAAQTGDSNDRADRRMKARNKESEANLKAIQIKALIEQTGFRQQGLFTLRAPEFSEEEKRLLPRQEWTVLNSKFEEDWRGRLATPADPVLHLGARDGPWGLMLEIPHKNIGQVLHAMNELEEKGLPPVLEVDFLLRTDPTRVYKGLLEKDQIAGKATPARTDNDEPESVVLAWVRIEGADIPEGEQLPRGQLLAGADVRAKIQCGQHRMGYALFYGVWEFFYEKVVFFF